MLPQLGPLEYGRQLWKELFLVATTQWVDLTYVGLKTACKATVCDLGGVA